MKINNYWENNKPQKRHNRTYKGSLTKRNKEKRDKRMLIFIAIWLTTIAYNAIASNSNQFIISNDKVVEGFSTASEATLPVTPERAELETALPEQVINAVIVEPTVEDVKKEIIKQSREFGLNENTMLALAFCESEYYYRAKNPTSTARGVYQYLIGTWEETESAKQGLERNNYKANIREAMIDISNGESWRWPDCKIKLKAKGIYL